MSSTSQTETETETQRERGNLKQRDRSSLRGRDRQKLSQPMKRDSSPNIGPTLHPTRASWGSDVLHNGCEERSGEGGGGGGCGGRGRGRVHSGNIPQESKGGMESLGGGGKVGGVGDRWRGGKLIIRHWKTVCPCLCARRYRVSVSICKPYRALSCPSLSVQSTIVSISSCKTRWRLYRVCVQSTTVSISLFVQNTCLSLSLSLSLPLPPSHYVLIKIIFLLFLPVLVFSLQSSSCFSTTTPWTNPPSRARYSWRYWTSQSWTGKPTSLWTAVSALALEQVSKGGLHARPRVWKGCGGVVLREPVWPSCKALGQTKGIRFGLSSRKVVVCGHCLVSLTVNETLKWLSSVPVLMQESFWWWQCSDRYIISPPPTSIPPSPRP